MSSAEQQKRLSVTRDLIKSFETGQLPKGEDAIEEDKLKEDIASITPGFTKGLLSIYESITKVPEEPKFYKIHVVFAHWERKGTLDGALLDTTVSVLKEQGHSVTVSDLYSMGFNPLPSKADIKDGVIDAECFNYAKEAEAAYRRQALSDDITDELEKLEDADLVVFQFPLCWGGLPAILKGYFDRVLVSGVVHATGMMFDEGKFKGKKALVSITTGDEETVYSNMGIEGEMDVFLWPIQNSILRFVGFDVLPANVFYSAPYKASDNSAASPLYQWKQRVTDILDEASIPGIPLANFDLSNGAVLKDEAIKKLSAENPDFGLSVGQNLGKPFFPILVYQYPEVCPEPEAEAEPEAAAAAAEADASAAKKEVSEPAPAAEVSKVEEAAADASVAKKEEPAPVAEVSKVEEAAADASVAKTEEPAPAAEVSKVEDAAPVVTVTEAK